MRQCGKAEALAQYALSYGWTANVEYGEDRDGVYADLSVTWSDADAWAIGCILRWYRDDVRGTWRLAELDGSGDPIGGMAEWIPRGTDYEFTLRSVKLLRRYIADRTDLIAWLNGERMRRTFAEQDLLRVSAKALAEQSR